MKKIKTRKLHVKETITPIIVKEPKINDSKEKTSSFNSSSKNPVKNNLKNKKEIFKDGFQLLLL